MAASAQMCRVSVRCEDRDTDLTVPAHLPVCELLASVAEVLGADGAGRDIRLLQAGGTVLAPDRSLAQSGVHDGEVLILTSATEAGRRPDFDVCVSVADAMSAPDTTAPDRRPAVRAVTAGLIAALFAGQAALLAVPALPGVLLATSAVSATALVTWRLTGREADALLPLSGVAMAAAAAALPAVLGWLPATSVGPLLTTAALAVLATSPRLTARLSGLSPSAQPEDIANRASTARRLLSGLVVTAGATTAAGTVLTVVLSLRPIESTAFVVTAAVLLLIRTKTYSGSVQVVALTFSAVIAVSVAVAQLATWAPRSAPWLSVLLIAGTLLVIAIGRRRVRSSRAAERVTMAVEFAAGAAVVPLGCAAGGLFAAIRGLL